MEKLNDHPWLKSIITPLSDDKTTHAVNDDNSDWEYIDAQIVKIGTISHNQLDIKKIQNSALRLLETETKDMRVMTHLLRTLQYRGNSAELLLALVLFTQYVERFWVTAYPNERLKVRLAAQILKRFNVYAEILNQNASEAESKAALACLSALTKFWQNKYAALDEELTLITQRITIPLEKTTDTVEENPINTDETSTAVTDLPALSIPNIDINVDNSNERAWKTTLIKITELLFEQFPMRDIAYRLRRTALWLNIDGIGIADSTGITELNIPISNDRLSEYFSAIPTATLKELKQVENSLTLSPYWFEGHFIAASMATQLGYFVVAEAIRDEVEKVLTRIPILNTLRFKDNSYFVSDNVKNWLNESTKAQHTELNNNDNEKIWQCYQNKGLEAALMQLENLPKQETRIDFYHQLLEIQLLEQSGFTKLADQHRKNIESATKTLTVNEWEPSFFALISKKND